MEGGSAVRLVPLRHLLALCGFLFACLAVVVVFFIRSSSSPIRGAAIEAEKIPCVMTQHATSRYNGRGCDDGKAKLSLFLSLF